jgi:hypothetical protein
VKKSRHFTILPSKGRTLQLQPNALLGCAMLLLQDLPGCCVNHLFMGLFFSLFLRKKSGYGGWRILMFGLRLYFYFLPLLVQNSSKQITGRDK